jgi:hypothetical protein
MPATSPIEERHQERRQSQDGDEEAIEDADRQADAQPGEDARGDAGAVERLRRDERGQRHHRPDRQVQLAGRERVGEAHRHHGDRRRLLEDVQQVLAGCESLVAEGRGEEDEDPQEDEVDDVHRRVQPTGALHHSAQR